jgi:hypothetical protein
MVIIKPDLYSEINANYFQFTRHITKVESNVNSYIDITYIQENTYNSNIKNVGPPIRLSFPVGDGGYCFKTNIITYILDIRIQLELHSLDIGEFINCLNNFTSIEKEELILKCL